MYKIPGPGLPLDIIIGQKVGEQLGFYAVTGNKVYSRMQHSGVDEWESVLPWIQWRYNSTYHPAMKFPPNELVFGRDLRPVLDAKFGVEEEETIG